MVQNYEYQPMWSMIRNLWQKVGHKFTWWCAIKNHHFGCQVVHFGYTKRVDATISWSAKILYLSLHLTSFHMNRPCPSLSADLQYSPSDHTLTSGPLVEAILKTLLRIIFVQTSSPIWRSGAINTVNNYFFLACKELTKTLKKHADFGSLTRKKAARLFMNLFDLPMWREIWSSR